MTNNQIAWINAQETQRANLAREGETHRSNVANEELGRAQLDETRRANSERELETIRHNRASENITLAQLAETKRSNQAKEYETHRSNRAKERETFRTNRNAELLKQIDQNNVRAEQLLQRQMHLEKLKHDYTQTGVSAVSQIASRVIPKLF